MKKGFLLAALFLTAAAVVFGADIEPGIADYIATHMAEDGEIVAAYPNTPQAAEFLDGLRSGRIGDYIFIEWLCGPSAKPIPSAVIAANKDHARVRLLGSIKSYIRGEIETLMASDGVSAELFSLTEASTTFAGILEESREIFRLDFRYRGGDGTNEYGTVFILAVNKSSVDDQIHEIIAQAEEPGPASRGDKTEPPKTAALLPPTRAEGGELLSRVREVMNGSEKMVYWREETRTLFEED
jgi:hypothetical protein